MTPLHDAIIAANKQMLKTVINTSHASPIVINSKDQVGRTPLALAMSTRLKHSFIALLLANGANPNEPDDFNRTPLHYITSDDQLQTVQLLVSSHYMADPNIKDLRGETPLQVAVLNRCYKIVAFLLKQSYVPVVQVHVDNYGLSLLHHAVLNNDQYMIDILKQHSLHAHYSIEDNNGNTPIDYARRNGNDIMVNQLLV